MTNSQRPKDQPQGLETPTSIQAAPRLATATESDGELIPAEAIPLNTAHGSFAEFQSDYVGRYIELADNKAIWTFTVTGAVVAFCLSNQEFLEATHAPSWNFRFILPVISLALLAISALFSFSVIAPRLRSSGEGIIYFGSVASFKSAGDYAHAVAAKSEAELYEARLRHFYALAGICATKYSRLRKAMWVGVFAFSVTALTIFLPEARSQ